MVSVREEDRNALRFLWVDDTEKSAEVGTSHSGDAFCKGSPFLLNATISHHSNKYRDRYPGLVETLLNSIDVDDVTCG